MVTHLGLVQILCFQITVLESDFEKALSLNINFSIKFYIDTAFHQNSKPHNIHYGKCLEKSFSVESSYSGERDIC